MGGGLRGRGVRRDTGGIATKRVAPWCRGWDRRGSRVGSVRIGARVAVGLPRARLRQTRVWRLAVIRGTHR